MKFSVPKHNLLIVLCLWLAFLLRVWGLDFGLPYKLHPDEHKYADAALAWYTTGQMDLELINPPLFTYILAAAYGLWFALVPFTPTDSWLTGAYVFARLWSVFLAMLTICLVYAVAKRLGNRKTGLVGAVLLSGLFLPAREAHFAVNDSAVTFFVLLAIYFSIRLFQHNGLSTYLTAGVATGLATAAKLTGGLVGLSLLVAHILLKEKKYVSSQNTAPRRIIEMIQKNLYVSLSLGVALLTFLLVSAHIFGELPLFIEVINKHLDFGTSGYKGLQMTPMNGWGFYGYVLGWGAGWLMVLAVCLALISVILHSDRKTLVLIVFPITLFAYMGAQKIVFARFILPAIPPLVVLVAVKLVELEKRWGFWQQHQVAVWTSIMALLLIQPLVNLIWFDHLLTLPDTRDIATEWFSQEFPANTSMARESYSILPNTVFLDKEWPYEIKNLSSSHQMKYGENHYLAQDREIIVLSNFTSGRIREDPTEEALRQKQVALLEQEATLIKEFKPYHPNYNGWFYLDELYGPAGETLQRTQAGPWLKVYRLSKAQNEE